MQKVLMRRVFRELKENILRYLALAFLIILCMYLIVSMVGAAETVIRGVDQYAVKNKLEDGEFSVFVPLTNAEMKQITDDGISLEKMFYLDYTQSDSSTLRIFQNRENINLIELDEGNLAESDKEVVIEKRYATEHKLVIGDQISIGEQMYTITGVGSVPDYDAPFKDLSDSSVDSKQFGLAFVSENGYQELQNAGKSTKSEQYLYAYRLNGQMTNEELSNTIKAFEFSVDYIEDIYFKEYWDETAGKKDEIKEGIHTLAEGTKELSEGLNKLSKNKKDLQNAASELFDSYLQKADEKLSSYGVSTTLTEENYQKILTDMMESDDNGIVNLKLNGVLNDLDKLKAYKDGIIEYSDGVSDASSGAEEILDGMNELEIKANTLMDEYFDVELSNLTQFLKVEENPRVKASADDQVINKIGGLVAGVIVMILFTYVISVFVVHGIEKESSVIGALYALGVKKRDLLLHYLMLPTVVTLVAGVIGTMIGFSRFGVDTQIQDCYNYFSTPALATVYPTYLVLYGIIMPPVVASLVNYFVIRSKLSKTALSLMRNEQKQNKIHNIHLGDMGFIARFRIRQMLREVRTSFTILFGMLISLIILMMAIDCYVMCNNISVESKADTKYEYMYTYKYPEQTVPSGGEAAYVKTLKKEIYGYNLDVTVLGIVEDSKYFAADVKEGKNKVVISTAVAQKYHLSVGDKLILTEEEENMDYAFTVEGIAQYSAGLYVFMDIDSMRELFGESDDYYNVVFSDNKLDIVSGRLYAVTMKADIEKSSGIFVSMMMPMIYMLSTVSILIFGVVMYLMIKVMIDRSAFNISLIKIFGYRTKEIRKLYLDGNLYIVAIGAAIGIPIAKKIMDSLYPILVSNIACGMNLRFSWQLYVGIYIAVMVIYFIINQLLVRKVKNVVLAEVLKNRE